MKKTLLVFGLISFLAFPSVAIAGECADPKKSPLMAIVTIDGKDIACCNIQEAYKTAFKDRKGAKSDDLNWQWEEVTVPVNVKGFDSGKMFSFYDGYYIIEHSLAVKNAGKPPYILAFPNLDTAWKYWDENTAKIGGRVVNFETATREFAKFTTGPSEKSKKKDAAAVKMVDVLLKYKEKGEAPKVSGHGK